MMTNRGLEPAALRAAGGLSAAGGARGDQPADLAAAAHTQTAGVHV